MYRKRVKMGILSNFPVNTITFSLKWPIDNLKNVLTPA